MAHSWWLGAVKKQKREVMKIKKSEISDEKRFVFDCPICGEVNELCDINIDEVSCEHCCSSIILEDD